MQFLPDNFQLNSYFGLGPGLVTQTLVGQRATLQDSPGIRAKDEKGEKAAETRVKRMETLTR